MGAIKVEEQHGEYTAALTLMPRRTQASRITAFWAKMGREANASSTS
jgi:hypothetical protein